MTLDGITIPKIVSKWSWLTVDAVLGLFNHSEKYSVFSRNPSLSTLPTAFLMSFKTFRLQRTFQIWSLFFFFSVCHNFAEFLLHYSPNYFFDLHPFQLFNNYQPILVPFTDCLRGRIFLNSAFSFLAHYEDLSFLLKAEIVLTVRLHQFSSLVSTMRISLPFLFPLKIQMHV